MRRYIWTASILALAGCANIGLIKVPPERVRSLQAVQLTTVTYAKPDFTAMTPAGVNVGMAFGAIGGAIGGSFAMASMIRTGNKIVQDNEVPDPAEAIATKLSVHFAGKFAASRINSISARDPQSDADDALSEAAGKRGVVLEVKTVNWMFGQVPFNQSRYRVTYVARARLIDAASSQMIGQVPCTYVSDDEKTGPSYDALLENRAALLKTKLEAAVVFCSERMVKEMLES